MAKFIQMRAAMLMDFNPVLSHLLVNPQESIDELNYCSNALDKTGFQLENNRESEIDELNEVIKDIKYNVG